MAPRWFKNVNFGRDITNFKSDQIIQKFKENFSKQVQEYSFDSTGPLIEEVLSEEEVSEPSYHPQPSPPTEEVVSDEEVYEPSYHPEPSPPAKEVVSEEEVSEPSYHPQPSPPTEKVVPEEEVYEPSYHPQPSPPTKEVVSEEEVYEPSYHPEPSPPTKEVVSEEEVYEPSYHLQPSRPTEPVITQEVIPDCRRTTRLRHLPLDFARCQRAIYRRGEFIRIDEGFPEKYNYGRKKSANAAPKRRKLSKPKLPAKCITVEPIPFKPSKTGNFLFQCERSDAVMSGALKLDPGKKKPETNSGVDRQYSFIVRRGQVILEKGDGKKMQHLYADENSGWVHVGPGLRYSVKNCGQEIAELAFIVAETQLD